MESPAQFGEALPVDLGASGTTVGGVEGGGLKVATASEPLPAEAPLPELASIDRTSEGAPEVATGVAAAPEDALADAEPLGAEARTEPPPPPPAEDGGLLAATFLGGTFT